MNVSKNTRKNRAPSTTPTGTHIRAASPAPDTIAMALDDLESVREMLVAAGFEGIGDDDRLCALRLVLTRLRIVTERVRAIRRAAL